MKSARFPADLPVMTTEQNPAIAYLRTRVLTAPPEQLRLLLLEGAIKFANQGREGLTSRNYEQSYTGITQCRDIVLELITSMRAEHDPELCERLRALYTFMYSQLVDASMERDLDKLDAVIRLLEYERETWVMLIDKLAAERATSCPEAPANQRRPAFTAQG